MKVIIVGGGIIGCSTAYYIRKLHNKTNPSEDLEIILIEQEAIAAAASGQAGGFLLNSNEQSGFGNLSRLSFELFKKLADQFGAEEIQYRPIDCYRAEYSPKTTIEAMDMSLSTSVDEPNRSWFKTQATLSMKPGTGAFRRNRRNPRPSYAPHPEMREFSFLNQHKLEITERVFTEVETAQVDPLLICKKFLKASGAKIIFSKFIGLKLYDIDKDKIESVIIENESGDKSFVSGDEFCFCMGPWSDKLRRIGLQVPIISGKRINSVSINTSSGTLPAATFFTNYANCEIFLRKNGSAYLNSSRGGEAILKKKPSATEVDVELCKQLEGFWKDIFIGESGRGLSLLNRKKIVSEVKAQAAYMPKVGWSDYKTDHKGEEKEDTRRPIFSRLPGKVNGYMSCGHYASGILLAPISGMIMAELILRNEPHAIIDIRDYQLLPSQTKVSKN
eukprot:augustus_masked-scaffold_61-processed-gene-0.0-mRNA-1 protein AED:1.00 eAED:1.00 QI:0/-1/0/0/-1/1/1/0/445